MAADTRDRLLDAVEDLMRTRGLARISTRAIARRAKLADGTLYIYFKDKVEIYLAVVQRNISEFGDLLRSLPLRVGQNTVRKNLSEVAECAFRSHQKVAPFICSMLADRELLGRYKQALRSHRVGPEESAEALSVYIAAEQRLGRVAANIAPDAVAHLLLGAAFANAVTGHFIDRPVKAARFKGRIDEILDTLMTGLEPRGALITVPTREAGAVEPLAPKQTANASER